MGGVGRKRTTVSRIVIFGNSGSGKSTLAEALARQAALEHLDLDALAWDRVNPAQRKPLDASRIELATFIQAHEKWVVEGCYSDLLSSVISHCTKLIFLNPGIDRCIQNCRKRPWEPHKYPSPEAQNKNVEMLIRWIREYETREDEFSLRNHRRLFDEFQGEKVEFTANQPMPNKLLQATCEDARA